MHDRGMTYREIGEELGFSPEDARRIVRDAENDFAYRDDYIANVRSVRGEPDIDNTGETAESIRADAEWWDGVAQGVDDEMLAMWNSLSTGEREVIEADYRAAFPDADPDPVDMMRWYEGGGNN